MALETATYIADLVPANPVHGDQVNQADAHMRLIKSVLQATFPNFTSAALTSTQAQIDAVVAGVVSGTGTVTFGAGTAAAPLLRVLGSLTTGIFSTGANKLAFTTNGVKAVEIDASQNVTFSQPLTGAGAFPIGGSMPWYSDTLPAGFGTFAWLNGQAVSRTTYATLFGIIGTVGGVGDGSTTFNLPDTRDNVLIGKGTMGATSAAGRVTNFVTSTLGNLFGECLHLLGITEVPAHSHTLTDPGHTHATSSVSVGASAGASVFLTETGTGALGTGTTASATTGITMANAGGGATHNNVQPSLVCNWVMRIA